MSDAARFRAIHEATLEEVGKADLRHFARAGQLAHTSTLRQAGILGETRSRSLASDLMNRRDRKVATAVTRHNMGQPSVMPKARTLASSPGSGWLGKSAAYSEWGTAPRRVQPRRPDGKYASHANDVVHVSVSTKAPKTSTLQRYGKQKGSPWGSSARKGVRL